MTGTPPEMHATTLVAPRLVAISATAGPRTWCYLPVMKHGRTLADSARLLLIAAIALAAAASAKKQTVATEPGPSQAPTAVAMDPGQAVGLWRTNFGPVKIERDPQGTAAEDVQGTWYYKRGSEDVYGVFYGHLRGNILDFQWQEPGVNGPLVGAGYIAFAPDGSRFDGQWWTDARDRSGGWNGSRAVPAQPTAPPAPPAAPSYGAAVYGGPPGPPPPPPY